MADLTITATGVIPSASAVIKRAKAASGVTITAGQVVYLDGTNGLKLTDADVSAAAAVASGIAINGGGPLQVINYVTRDPKLAIGATVAIGSVYVTSGTAGGIAAVADIASGDYVTVLGVGVSTTEINFDPSVGATVDDVLLVKP